MTELPSTKFLFEVWNALHRATALNYREQMWQQQISQTVLCLFLAILGWCVILRWLEMKWRIQRKFTWSRCTSNRYGKNVEMSWRLSIAVIFHVELLTNCGYIVSLCQNSRVQGIFQKMWYLHEIIEITMHNDARTASFGVYGWDNYVCDA